MYVSYIKFHSCSLCLNKRQEYRRFICLKNIDGYKPQSIIIKGQGIGRKSVYGKVVIAKNAIEALAKVTEGCILVTIGSDKEMVPAIEKCSALIAEEGGLTSHAAIVGLNLDKVVLVGISNATTRLKDGQEVTVDANKGIIYDGYVHLS